MQAKDIFKGYKNVNLNVKLLSLPSNFRLFLTFPFHPILRTLMSDCFLLPV